MGTPTSCGGNNDTGGIAECFFYPDRRDDICIIIINESH